MLTEGVEGFEEAIRACENPMMQTDYDIQHPPHTSEQCSPAACPKPDLDLYFTCTSSSLHTEIVPHT